MILRRICTTVILVLLYAHVLNADDGVDLFNKATVWRVFHQVMPPVYLPSTKTPAGFRDETTWKISENTSLPPAAGWESPDFDDQGWAQMTDVAGPRSGATRKSLAGQFLRADLGIDDPAQVKGLTLALVYRGGVVVYVNGKEIGRKNLPDGKIDSTTLASEYPVAAFALDGDMKAREALRPRSFDLAIPTTALRKGVNVVAIESRRSAYRMEGLLWENKNHRDMGADHFWATAGLISVNLKAASDAGLGKPSHPPVRVWNAATAEPVGSEVADADPWAELRPVAMQAARGGTAAGQVIVSSDAAIGALTAEAGALSGPGGSLINPKAVRLRFAWPRGKGDNRFGPLQDSAPSDAKVIPVWISIEVPADAKPGIYNGQITLRGAVARSVPLRLEIFDWVVAEPRQWKTWMFSFQSPETLANTYKVPLWSDAHFALIEQSLILQGGLGQRIAIVHAIDSKLLNDKTMVLYRREGNKVVPDFSAVERYLTLYQKHVGPPAVVMLHLWDSNVDDKAVGVTLRDGNGFKDETLPVYGQPGADEPWKSVVEGLKGVLTKQGIPEKALMLGMTCDGITSPAQTAFFAKHFPDMPWMTYCHGQPPAKPLKLGLMTNPQQGGGSENGYGWRTPRGQTNLTNLRAFLGQQSDPISYRRAAAAALIYGFNGVGGIGLDYWNYPVTEENGKVKWRNHFNGSGQDWGRIIRQAPICLLASGPEGPVSTVM